MDFNSVNRTGSIGPFTTVPEVTAETTGTYKHESVTRVPAQSMGGLAKSRASASRAAQAARKTLNQLGLRSARPLARLSAQQLATAQRASQHNLQIRKLAISLLKNGTAAGARGRRGVTAGYLAHRVAGQYGSDEEEESDDGLALVTPVRGNPATAQELAELLRDTYYSKQGEEGRQALAELMHDVEGMGHLKPDDLFDELSEVWHNPEQLAAKLRKAQGLPARGSDALRKLRASLHDAAADMEEADGGLIFSSINASAVALDQHDADKFLDAYSDLVDPHAYRQRADSGADSERVNEELRFSTQIGKLLERFSPDELRNVLPALKQALADDLDAATQSQDPVWLHKVLTDMGHLHVAGTLLEMMDTMVTQFNRMSSDEARAPLDTRSLMNHVKTVLDSGWTTSSQFNSMAEKLGLPEGAPTIRVLTGMRAVLARLPTRVFQDDTVRQSTLTALQGALDHAIEQEEAALDSEDLTPAAAPPAPAAPSRLH